MNIYKYPLFNDDSYYFRIDRADQINQIEDSYMFAKRKAFSNMDISIKSMEGFLHRKSFTNVEEQSNLIGTIYTVSAMMKNDMDFRSIIETVSRNKDKSRRCVVVIADKLSDYMDDTVNTSCLNIIHYFQDTVKLFFRASDIKNELLYDINLIKEFFIDPVYSEQPQIHVIASTAQNIVNIEKLIVKQ